MAIRAAQRSSCGENIITMKKDRVQKLLLDQLRRVPILEVACEKANVSRMSVNRWRKDDKEFDKAVTEAMNEGDAFLNDLTESQLISLIKDKHWPAISFWLRTRNPKFKEKIEISGQITHREQRELTPEEIELRKEALRLALPKSAKAEEEKEKNN